MDASSKPVTLRKCGLEHERRDRWGGKKCSFGKSLVLTSSAGGIEVTASGDGYQDTRAAFGRFRELCSSLAHLFHW